MKFTEFAATIRYYTGTDSTTFADADILLLANNFKNEIAGQITAANEDYFVRTFLANLNAGQRQYSIPDEILNNIKYVEAKLDGVTQKHLDEFDINSYRKSTDEATIVAQFAGKNPMFDLEGGSLIIYSDSAIISVTQGLILKAVILPANFTSLSSTIDMATDPDAYSCGFPLQFHELLARRVAMAWKSSRPKPVPLSEVEKLYKTDLADKIEALKGMNLDRAFAASVPGDDGQNY